MYATHISFVMAICNNTTPFKKATRKMTGSPMIFQLKRIYLTKKKQGSTYVSATSFLVHILSKAQVTLKKMEHMKNTVDMAHIF